MMMEQLKLAFASLLVLELARPLLLLLSDDWPDVCFVRTHGRTY